MFPFYPVQYGSQKVSLGTSVAEVTLPNNSSQVLIDNRGVDDVLVEFGVDPADATSFRIPGNTSQVLTLPTAMTATAVRPVKLRLKRPSGAATADVFVCGGNGI